MSYAKQAIKKYSILEVLEEENEKQSYQKVRGAMLHKGTQGIWNVTDWVLSSPGTDNYSLFKVKMPGVQNLKP